MGRDKTRTMTTWNPEEATSKSDGLPDTEIVPYVEALRDAGVETLQSCSGHPECKKGYKNSGHMVWIADEPFMKEFVFECDEFSCLRKEYIRYKEPAWEIYYPGLSKSEEALERAMNALFTSLGVNLP